MEIKNKVNTKPKVYGPNERDFLEVDPKEVKAYSLEDYTILPDNVQDPIVSNNISYMEFDYTYNGGEDLLGFSSELPETSKNPRNTKN
jgi:hypothetical protein